MEVARPFRRAGGRNPPIERRQRAAVRPYTYVWTWDGWADLVAIVDMLAKVVGWRVATLCSDLAPDALGVAVWSRRSQQNRRPI